MVENLTFDEKPVFIAVPKAGLADEQMPPVLVDLNSEK
jgi:hypothetical protein